MHIVTFFKTTFAKALADQSVRWNWTKGHLISKCLFGVFNYSQGAAVSNEKSLFTHRFNRWRWPLKDCDF